MQHGYRYFVQLILLVAFLTGMGMSYAVSDAPDDADDSDWPAWVDEEDALLERAALVNEGELTFLPDPGGKPLHHHSNHITIGEDALRDGWVLLEQCHTDLDRVPAVQIVFNAENTRALEVIASENIGEAFAEGHTVQLRDVGAGSRICIRARSRALWKTEDGEFELRNGPFMRRFLDGYYPLRLSLRIDYPDAWQLAGFTPDRQTGFTPRHEPGRIELDTVFEGRLNTRFRFRTQ